jgi:hypothetical protein
MPILASKAEIHFPMPFRLVAAVLFRACVPVGDNREDVTAVLPRSGRACIPVSSAGRHVLGVLAVVGITSNISRIYPTQ